MEQLQCAVHSYAWGKLGRASLVAQLMEASDQGFRAHEDTAYAELWMGTHPNGPAKIVRGGVSAKLLSEWLKDHPEAAGKVSTEGELPFLFKVLSVGKALSIQAHPDIELAQALHKKAPNVYKDPNHKPEMAIALTRFEALCQFRPIDEIVGHIANISELQAIADRDGHVGLVARSLMQNRDQSSLQTYFQSYINADEDTIRAQTTSIRKRLSEKHPTELSDVDRLVLRLIDQYGHDIGCLCPYLLNYITLEPGEAVFLGANEPHAYLFGDCIECMACSDNVVRAGLTPKFIDKETLSGMLTYRTSRPTILSGDRLNDNVRVYTPPVPEFEIEAINIRPSCSLPTKARSAASILVVISGTGTAYHGSNSMELCPGRTLLIGAGESVEIEASKVSESPLVAYRAFPNESGSERGDEANFNVKGAKGSSERP